MSTATIQTQLEEINQKGPWWAENIRSPASIDAARDDVLGLLTSVESELERLGLWDRVIEAGETEGEEGQEQVSLEEIKRRSGCIAETFSRKRQS